MIQLSIIIVHYKTLELTQRCLLNLDIQKHWEIIIVDNNSQDGAKDKILKEHPYIKWITNPENEGFGRANNIGVAHSKGEFILLLNSDMLVEHEAIQKCIEYFDLHSNVGVLGCKLINEDGSLQKSTYAFIGENEEIWRTNLLVDKIKRFKEPKNIRAVMGSFFIMRKEDFQQLEGFDPDFFMYCEELDLCDRVVNELNKEIIYYPDIRATHKHGGSSEGSWSAQQTWLSRALLVYKRKGLFYYITYHFVMSITILTNFLLGWKIGKEYQQSWRKTVRAYRSNRKIYFQIPFIYSRKRGNGKNMLIVNQQ